MNKLCFYTPPYPGLTSWKDMIDAAVSCGLHAVEGYCMLELGTPDIEAAKRIREYADKKQVVFPCFSLYAPLASEMVSDLQAYADVAKILGSPYLHHTIVAGRDYKNILPRKETLFAEGIEAVRQVYDYAESIGVKAIYEEQGYIFNGVEGFGAFLDAVDREVGVVADFGNIYQTGDGFLEFVEAYKEKVVHAHIKDIIIKDENPDGKGLATLNGTFMFPSPAGTGIVPIREGIDLLKAAGYDGYYGIEFQKESEEAMKEVIEQLSSLL